MALEDMSPEDLREWNDLQGRIARQNTPKTVRWLPEAVARPVERARAVGVRAQKGIIASPAFGKTVGRALDGLLGTAARGGAATISSERIVGQYAAAGHDVRFIEDIRRLELLDIDRVKPNWALRYASAAAAEGAVTGAVASGGTVALAGGTVLGAGAGGVPGAATVATALAVDLCTVVVLSNRAVADIAGHYGYDVRNPSERAFAMSVMSYGTASASGKALAYREVNKVARALARRATWQQLRSSVVTRLVEQVYERLGQRLLKRQLAKAVPLLGSVAGAGLNAKTMTDVCEGAESMYRERLLRERYDLAQPLEDTGDESTQNPADDDLIDVVTLVERPDRQGEEGTRESAD